MEWSEVTSSESSHPEITTEPLKEVLQFGKTIDIESYETIRVNLNKQRVDNEIQQKEKEKKENPEKKENEKIEETQKVWMH